MTDRYQRFVRSLAAIEDREGLCNPWSRKGGDRANGVRRRNLRLYLEALAELEPRTILVGEALGYRGGRLSGVPFTSISLLLESDRPMLRARDFGDPGDAGRIRGEASATMVWSAISRLPVPPLLWNACPFHPHRPGDRRSNRAPRADEVHEGSLILRRLTRLYPIEQFVAVGRVASRTLDRLGIEHLYVRHPSLGGKQEFERGLCRTMNDE